MDAGGCSHIENLFADDHTKANVLSKYEQLARWSVSRLQSGTPPSKRRKVSPPTCSECGLDLTRPFACLHCEFIGCWTDAHIAEHMSDEDHLLCADAKTGAVFCVECNDFVYDRELEETRQAAVLSAEERETRFQSAKKPREPYKPWAPSTSDQAALEGSTIVPCQGRRGLLNLGQTCFLNSVLQAFLHTPLIRAYFLSDKHNQLVCKTKDCTCCELDELFSEAFSGSGTPFAPTGFLTTMWRASAELAGYSQQDAHEAFVSVRHGLHASARGSTQSSCNCIVHDAFGGMLQSNVRCAKCATVTQTLDPIMDVPLEVRGEDTLAACLRKLTSPEELVGKDYACSKCKSSGEATKTFSIKKLAPILVFHLKRFEHKTNNAAARKVDDKVRFPTSLNMLAYTTIGMTAVDKENARAAPPSKNIATGPETMYAYELYSVVCHEGAIDNGHYYTYARYQDEWWRYDDDKVTKSDTSTVLNSPAYMLFYCKKRLDYKPHATPSYVLARENEARREEEREREKEAAKVKELDDALLGLI